MTNPNSNIEIQQYIETRLNLLTVLIDKLEESVRERIDAVEAASVARWQTAAMRFQHQEKITNLIKEATDIAASKVEATQKDINVANNEWRVGFQDYRKDTATRAELERLDKSFDAYKLEVAQTIAARQISDAGVREGSRDSRQDSRSNITLWAGIAGTVAAIVVGLLTTTFNRPGVTPQASVVSSEKRVDDLVERLNALSTRLNQIQSQPQTK